MAGTGPMPMVAGSQPAAADSGPAVQAERPEPVLVGDHQAGCGRVLLGPALPATVPPWGIACSLARASAVESGRTPSSLLTSTGSPRRC